MRELDIRRDGNELMAELQAAGIAAHDAELG